MGRLTPLTTRMTNRAIDLYLVTREHLERDGLLCDGDERVLVGIKRLGADSDRLDKSRRAARTLEDAGEMTVHATRLIHELERDLAPILALSPNYPRRTEIDLDTA